MTSSILNIFRFEEKSAWGVVQARMMVAGIFKVARNQGPGGQADLAQSLEFYVPFLSPLAHSEEIVIWHTRTPTKRSMARARVQGAEVKLRWSA